MRDAGCVMRDVGCGMRDVGCGMRDVGCEMWDEMGLNNGRDEEADADEEY